MLNLGPTLLDAGFLHCIPSASSLDPKLHRGSRGSPRPGVAFPTTPLLQLAWNSTGNSTGPLGVEINWNRTQFVGLILSSNSHAEIWTRLRNFFRYLAIGMCHFRYLWNGLCDRHRAEITVMQFTGHSLPVRQSMRVPWEFFYLVPFHQPISAHAISSHNVSLPSGASP